MSENGKRFGLLGIAELAPFEAHLDFFLHSLEKDDFEALSIQFTADDIPTIATALGIVLNGMEVSMQEGENQDPAALGMFQLLDLSPYGFYHTEQGWEFRENPPPLNPIS